MEEGKWKRGKWKSEWELEERLRRRGKGKKEQVEREDGIKGTG